MVKMCGAVMGHRSVLDPVHDAAHVIHHGIPVVGSRDQGQETGQSENGDDSGGEDPLRPGQKGR